MGILNTIMSSFGGGNARGGASPMQGILGSLLGGGNQGGSQGMMPGTGPGMGGGLAGLLSKFEGAVLGWQRRKSAG